MKDQRIPAIIPGNMPELYGYPWVFDDRGFRYYVGSKGVGMYTTNSDGQGWYHFGYLKPVGEGARRGQAENYHWVERTAGRRRKRKDAEDRAFHLSNGSTAVKVEKKQVDTPDGYGYCVKCREHHRIMNPEIDEAKNGRTIIKGTCIQCGTRIQKFGKLIDCPECNERKESSANDYICKECRSRI